MFGLVSQRRFNELQDKYSQLQKRIDEYEKIQTRNKELETEIYSLKNELNELSVAKKQIREQIEADLFFISAKIQKKLLDGEPKKDVDDLRLQQLAYQSQLSQMQQQSSWGNQFLSGLGLSTLFGRNNY